MEKTNPLPDLLCPVFRGHIYIYIHTDTHDHYFYGWVDFFKYRENDKKDEKRWKFEKTRKSDEKRRKNLDFWKSEKPEALKVDRIYGLII